MHHRHTTPRHLPLATLPALLTLLPLAARADNLTAENASYAWVGFLIGFAVGAAASIAFSYWRARK